MEIGRDNLMCVENAYLGVSPGCFPSKERSQRHQHFLTLVWLLFILDLVLAGVVPLVGYYFYHDTYNILPALEKEKLENISVYCENLSLSPDDDEETFVRRKNDFEVSIAEDGKYICNYRKNKLNQVIRKVVERQSRLMAAQGFNGRPYLSCGNETLAPKSGHQTLTFYKISSLQTFEDNTTASVIHWDKHHEKSYIAPGIHYHMGEITIPERRIYYAYASVHVRVFQRPGHKRSKTLKMKLCRKTFNSEVTLLSDTKNLNISSDSGVTSLQVGGQLQLESNDVIYLKVSDPRFLIEESSGNTIGLFPM